MDKREILEVDGTVLSYLVATQLYMFFKIHKTVHMKEVEFQCIQFYSNKPDQTKKPERSELENNMHFNMPVHSMTLGDIMKQSEAYTYVACYKCTTNATNVQV